MGDRGQKVVLALAGATLFDGHAKEKVLKELKPGKIRGVASNGMVCSLRELGVSDEHEGIVLLDADFAGRHPIGRLPGRSRAGTGGDAEPGPLPIHDRRGPRGSGPDRAKIRLPPHQMQATGKPIGGQVQVVIEDPKLSARYAAALIKE